MSVYGGTMLPPHPPMAEGPGGPMYNGLHAADPAWSPIIKVVPNSADSSDPQQQVGAPRAEIASSGIIFDAGLCDAFQPVGPLLPQVWPGTWAPHVGNVHLNHVN